MPKLYCGDKGPCEVEWGYGESNMITLAPFLGKVTLKQTDTISDIEEEAMGVVDAIFEPSKAELDIPMTRSTLTQLEAVLNGVLVGSVLSMRSMVGCDMYAHARALAIKPVCDNVVSIVPSEWTILYKTYPYRKWSLDFDRTTQRVFLIGFKVFISQESGTFGEFGSFGTV